jgi:hypothetical protein
MELLLGHEKIITKSRISLNAGTLNRGFTVVPNGGSAGYGDVAHVREVKIKNYSLNITASHTTAL